ncbi:hypothetical protein BD770DRAFT_376227 [Pilaira anomala]|nr:hypothetical protein BD770DRAFT_376227 [Pilaira anomala]
MFSEKLSMKIFNTSKSEESNAFEHPSLSYIVDLKDLIWIDYFFLQKKWMKFELVMRSNFPI